MIKYVKRVLKRIRSDQRIGATATVLLLALTGYWYLGKQANVDANLRKNTVALEFEATPDAWLLHPASVSAFRQSLATNQLKAVGQVVSPPNLLLYTLKTGATASVRVPNCSTFVCADTVLGKLEDQSVTQGFSFVRVDVDPRAPSQRLLDWISGLTAPLTMILSMVAAMYFVFKMQTGGSAASRLTERPTLRFHDVVGNLEAKTQLNRVLAFMQNPGTYSRIGARAPRGVLMVGPPGTGKTLLARALAGESGANFIAVDGSYFTAMYYGAGVAKVKALFALARNNAPCVLFIDEVDGVSKRVTSSDMRGPESETNRIINCILTEMDGFEPLEDVVVVAATNHEENIDEAMRRPGRFDVLARLSLPALPDRKELFELYLNKVTRDPVVDTSMLARMTAGASPADIANLVNKASSCAAEGQADCVSTKHVLHAIETFRMGGEVSPIKDLLSAETRERLAYHEAAHALVGHWLQLGTVEHLTIEPRGEALGVTYITRESEDPLYKESELSSRIAMVLAGREAELLVFDSVSTGAADDLKKATELALRMVGSFGFSKEFGVLSVAGVPKELLGPDVQAAVLRAARELLEKSQQTCHQLLTARRGHLNAVARALLEKEVLSGAELQGLLNGPA